jgi:hypothetical protein
MKEMELSYARCEQILNTLPIGYYTGRRISISLDAEESTSFYSPLEDTIVVSYPIIAHRAKAMPDNADTEEAVRSMLYHEVSHAILTPSQMQSSNITNIFEDERIETVLRNYYHNVDFRKQLYDLHHGFPPEANNAEKAFYNAVRFGLGKSKVQNEVTRILKKFSKMNRNTEKYGLGGIYDYESEIEKLYNMIAEEFKQDPDQFQPQGGKGEQNQMDKLRQENTANNNNGSQKQDNSSENGEEEKTEEMPDKIGDTDRDIEMSIEDVKRMVGASLGQKPNLSAEQQERLDEFQKTAEMIISNFNKKNSGGSGINAYSGVFNPRAVVRQDYRFFERSMSTQGNNKSGTCHLNLIIDCSGSFSGNATLTNAIIAVLTEIERKNRNFSMDVAFINHELHVCNSVRDRRLQAWGGNRIPDNMKEVLMNLQKPKTCNYNIILFDGDAMCNNNDCHSMNAYRQRFGVFDMKQTTLITDPENQQYLGDGFTSTKVVVTKKYTEELVRHITRALTIAFG